MNYTPTRETQDWQLDALERKYRHDSISRHKHVVDEMDSHPTQWGVNMSKRKINNDRPKNFT